MKKIWRRHKRGYAHRKEPVSLGRQLLWGGVFLSVLVFVCLGTWYVTRLPFFTITHVIVTGGETVPHEKIQTIVEDNLLGNHFLLIPHRFSYLYPHEQIHAALRHEVRIHNVVVERRDMHTLTVSFDEYVPYALWCERKDMTARCLFVNEAGYAFSPAPPMRGGTFLRHVVEGMSLENRTQVFETAQFANMHQFIALLEAQYPFKVIGTTLTNATDVTYRLRGGGSLLTDNTIDAETIFQNVATILSSSEFAHITPGNFEYIDFRFGDKVFVHEGLEEETASSSVEAVYVE